MSQQAYEAAVYPLFESLDRLEKILDGQEYLVGNTLTEADVRLFVTIVRVRVRLLDLRTDSLFKRSGLMSRTMGFSNVTSEIFGMATQQFICKCLGWTIGIWRLMSFFRQMVA